VGDLCVVPAPGVPHEVSVRCRTVTVMSKRVEFRWPEALLERVDASRGDVSRASFVRRAVERALDVELPPAVAFAALQDAIDGAREQPRALSRTEAFRRATQK